jgi:prepilin-type N-terminal cleavage/methylation domain-containing protein/prepilin-type processing-associated H-X9-DG protein
MGTKRTLGFTLIELLVVIAIIAILAAILFPVFAQARNAARKTTCISNLKQIALGQLMYVQDYDEQFSYWDWGKFPGQDSWATPNGMGWWMNQTQPYIKNRQLLVCPNDTRPDSQTNGWGYAIIPGTNPVQYYKSSYGISEWIVSIDNPTRKQSAIPLPAQTVMYTDAIGPLINDWDSCGGEYPYGFTRTWFANYDAWGPWGQEQNYERFKQYARHGEGSVISYIDGHAGYLPNRAWRVQRDPNGVCPSSGKRQKPIIAPYHEPF